MPSSGILLKKKQRIFSFSQIQSMMLKNILPGMPASRYVFFPMIPGSFKEAFYGLNIELHTLILNAGVMALPQRRLCGRPLWIDDLILISDSCVWL